MAEFVMKDLVRQAGLEWKYEIASAATSSEELGNPVYPPVRRILEREGIDVNGKYATPICRADYPKYDRFVCM
jgi:protein-tyrosine phosphatase